jgi:Fe-S cluster biogenesis protein NfuA
MALHGAGLERILEIAASFGETGKNLIEHCSRDELVSSLLLLYGLHPDNLPTRVERALQRTKPFLESHGAQAELLSISGEAGVRVRLHHQSGGGCGSAAGSLRSTLETAIQDAAPDAMDIVVEEPAAALLGFIPVGNLQNGQPLSASHAGNPVRSKG